MNNFLAPIKILLDMDVKTKSTYRAALEGIDLSMNKILADLDYDPNEDKNFIQLHRHSTDFRMEDAKNRLAAFATNKEIGICDFVKHARNVMCDFLQVIKLGHLHNLYMDNSGMFNVEISCMLHESGLESNVSTKARFEEQLEHLKSLGFELRKIKGVGSYRFFDSDSNRDIIKQILSERGASLIKISSRQQEIDKVSFLLAPIDLHNFVESPAKYTLPVTDELNEDEMIKMKKLVNEIPSSLAFIKESPSMLQTCAYVAESSFADICEIVAFDGIISKRVRERYAKERAANMNIHEIEKEIGEQFPADITRNTMEKVAATIAYFCINNLHAMTMNLIIDQWGTIQMDIKISQRSEDLRYVYYFDDKYNEPIIPTKEMMGKVFDIVENRNGGIRLIDNESNRKMITDFIKSTCGFDIKSISIIRDDCYITRAEHGTSVSRLENVFIIDQVSVSMDSIEGILRQHELYKMRKDVK